MYERIAEGCMSQEIQQQTVADTGVDSRTTQGS